jgi:hypothetical protein
MPAARARTRPRGKRDTRRSARRTRRLAGLVVVCVVIVVSLLLTAFGTGRTPTVQTFSLAGRLPAAGRPFPQVVALKGALRLQLPVAQPRVTAVGFHGAGDGAISLSPIGHQANEGLVLRVFHKLFGGGGGKQRWYQLGGSGPSNSAVDVGAAPGTDVYSPVDGTVVGISPYIVNGKRYGVRLDIQPQTAPSFIVSVTHLHPDRAIAVGSPVIAGVSRIGSVADLSSVEHEALARFTQDAGNHVAIEVRPAAASALSN